MNLEPRPKPAAEARRGHFSEKGAAPTAPAAGLVNQALNRRDIGASERVPKASIYPLNPPAKDGQHGSNTTKP